MTPVATNAQYQPQVSVIHGTTSGVASAPTFVPELKIPVASARSRLGNHSAVALIAAGKFPASPMPRAKRAAMNPATEAEYVSPTSDRIAAAAGPKTVASACAIAARLQTTIAIVNPSRTPSQSMTRPATRNPAAYASWNAKTMSA